MKRAAQCIENRVSAHQMNTGYTSLTQSSRRGVRDRRERVELILSRADLLDESDRTLIRMYIENNNSFRQIANLCRVNEATVSRRIKRIIDRLGNDGIETALTRPGKLTRRQRRIACDYFVRGLTAKKIACKYNISYYSVLKTINVVRKLTNHKAYSAEVASATKAGHKTTVRNY